MKYKIERKKIYICIITLLCVVPQYLTVAKHNMLSMTIAFVAILYFFSNNFRITISKDIFPVLIFVLGRNIAYIYHGEYLTALAFTFILLTFSQIIFEYAVTKEKFLKVIDYIIFVSIFFGILGIVEGITGNNFLLLLNNTGEVIKRNETRLGLTRIIGFTTQTSHYALYSGMMAFLCLYRFFCNTKKKYFAFTFILQIINLVFTGSRTVILSFAISLLLILIKRGVKKFMLYMIASLIFFLISLLIFNQSYIGQFLLMFLSQLVPQLEKLLKVGAVSIAEQSNMVGDRIRLYSWVMKSVKGHYFFGFGEKSRFTFDYIVYYGGTSWIQTKNSIEVNYLFLIYHYGFVGMITEIYMILSYTLKSIKYSARKLLNFDGRLNFNYFIFIILILMILSWFGIMEGEEIYIFYMILYLFVSYNKLLANTI